VDHLVTKVEAGRKKGFLTQAKATKSISSLLTEIEEKK
jgi:hypothetical protein